MKIGARELPNRVVSAPMAGVTDKAYRKIALSMDCGLVYTEMISDMALLYSNERTLHMLDIRDEPGIVSVQLFGSVPETMARAAKIIEASGAAIIDINMGCPAPKIVKNGEGAALLRDLPRARAILHAVRKAVQVPLTVKMRLGWDSEQIVAPELVKIAEVEGLQGVAIHGRTREQFYSGKANWSTIAEIKAQTSLPVIGNGDVWTPEDAQRLLQETHCDGIMVGRAAMGNPWLFKQITELLATGSYETQPTAKEKLQMTMTHFELLLAEKGEYVAVREMRKHASWYIKGLPEAAKWRNRINYTDSAQEMILVLNEYLSLLKA